MNFKVLLLFVSAVFCQNQFKGDVCHKDGVAGVCLSLGQCKSAREDIQNRIYPQLCSYENRSRTPIVCCVEENSGKPVKPTRPPVQEEEPQCEPMPEGYTPPKTGQKAFGKCIEYQQKYVYPCERGVDILGSFSRQIRCHHKTDQLIIGGTDAAQYEFPHMVMLGFGPLRSLQWLCGGAIISERFVLTAGHCISLRKNDPVTYIAIGALRRSDANDQSKIYKVKNVTAHPQYKSPSIYNDIALIETERVMELDQFTVPACLHTGDLVNDTQVIAAGWGLTHDKGEQLSDTLKRVILTKFSKSECSLAYEPFRRMQRGFDGLTQSCYGDRETSNIYQGRKEYKDTCQGDSGGPIQIKDQKIHCMYTIVGVTSVGKSRCGNGLKPAVYTRVAQYLPWIEKTVWP